MRTSLVCLLFLLGTTRAFMPTSHVGLTISPTKCVQSTALFLGAYTDAAKALFSNIIGPASMLTGGMVPFWLFSPPLPQAKEKWKKRVRCVYDTFCVVSILNELLAIMYATVASNSLTRVAAKPASSVFDLIQRDYELSWVATNVHFMLGLFGFGGMVMTTVLLRYPAKLNSSLCGLAFSALLGMASIANVGVVEGDEQGQRLGSNIFSLGLRYIFLSMKSVAENRTVTGFLSFALFLFFGIQTIRSFLSPDIGKEYELKEAAKE